MKIQDLQQTTVVGLGLLGGSVGLAISRHLPHVKRIGYSHRAVTRNKAHIFAFILSIISSSLIFDIRPKNGHPHPFEMWDNNLFFILPFFLSHAVMIDINHLLFITNQRKFSCYIYFGSLGI